MNRSAYLPNGFVSSLSEQEIKLVNTLAEIAYKRRAAGLQVFSRTQSFCLLALNLATDYKDLKRKLTHETVRGPALTKISRACSDLQLALQAIDQHAIEALRRAIISRNIDDIFDEYSPLSSTHVESLEWLQARGLDEMQKAAASLALSRSRGRQAHTAERWASLEFVRLCHSEGWTNVQVANGGSENKNAQYSVPSDAVICLAAVFEISGTSPARSLSLANTALRSLRQVTQHVVLHRYGPEEDAYEEYEQYEISLKTCVSDSIKLLAELPNFIPKGH